MAKPEPEFADVARLARRFLAKGVEAARADERPLRRVLLDHLGAGAATLPTASATWPTWDHVNIQVGLDAWLAASAARRHQIVGIGGVGMSRHVDISITDFAQPGHDMLAAGATGVMTEAVPCGPGGQTRPCVINGIYLVTDAADRPAVMVRPVSHGPRAEIVLQVAGPTSAAADAALAEIRRLALAGSVFRGQVLSFGPELLGPGWGTAPLTFLERQPILRSEVILPAGLLADIERQVLGVARHSRRLLASGQHLRRGVLLHGAPGTGKTHTVSFLLGQMPDVTAVVISGRENLAFAHLERHVVDGDRRPVCLVQVAHFDDSCHASQHRRRARSPTSARRPHLPRHRLIPPIHRSADPACQERGSGVEC